jgi:hypothetical protein
MVLAVLALSACAADNKFASDAEVAQARFVSDAPPSITLFTVLSTRNGSGAHSGLLINGTERVMFDPAGTWQHPRLPERHDVHFGITDKMIAYYIDYHARVTFDVVEQTVMVTPQQAAIAMARAKAYGAVPKTQCSRSISTILAGVPGFEGIGGTISPKKLSADFAAIPGATLKTITDDDDDNNHGVLLVQANGEPLDKPADLPQ